MSIRIVVCLDVPAETAVDAYRMVRDVLGALPSTIEWETADDWYDNDGNPISTSVIDAARFAVWNDDRDREESEREPAEPDGEAFRGDQAAAFEREQLDAARSLK